MNSKEEDQDILQVNHEAECEGGCLPPSCDGELEPRRDDGSGQVHKVLARDGRSERADEEVDKVAAAVADASIADPSAAITEAEPNPPFSSPQEGTTDGETVTPRQPQHDENENENENENEKGDESAEGDGYGDVSSPQVLYRGGSSSADTADGDEDDDPSNLIINYVPDIDEEELASYFNVYGPLRSVKMVRDKRTGKAQGYAFVHFVSADHAAVAIQKTNRMILREEKFDPVANRMITKEKMIKVAIASRRRDEIKNCKLVIKGTPPPEMISVDRMAEILGKFGNVVEVRLVRRMCFVQYRTRAEAEYALSKLHSSSIGSKGEYPLEVEFATRNYNSVSAANSALSSPMNSPPNMSPYTSPQENYCGGGVGGAYRLQGTMTAPRLGFATAPGAGGSYAHHPAAADAAHMSAGAYGNGPLQVQILPQQIQHTQPPHQSPQQQHGTVTAQPAERTHFLQQQKHGTPPAQYRQSGSPRAQKAPPHVQGQGQGQGQAQGHAMQRQATVQQQRHPHQLRASSGASSAQHYAALPQQPQQSPQAYHYQQPPQSPQQQSSPAQAAYHMQQQQQQNAQSFSLRNPAGALAAPHFAQHQQVPFAYGPVYSPNAPQQAFPGAPQQPYTGAPPQPYPHAAPQHAYPHGHGAPAPAPQQAYPRGQQQYQQQYQQHQQHQARVIPHPAQTHQQSVGYTVTGGAAGGQGQSRAVYGPATQQQSRTANAAVGGGLGRGDAGATAGRGHGGRKKTTLRSMPDATSQPRGVPSASSNPRQQPTTPGNAPNGGH